MLDPSKSQEQKHCNVQKESEEKVKIPENQSDSIAKKSQEWDDGDPRNHLLNVEGECDLEKSRQECKEDDLETVEYLNQHSDNTSKLEQEMLPTATINAAQAMFSGYGIHLNMATTNLLAAEAMACQGHFQVETAKGKVVPLNLYTFVLAPTGEGKSTSQELAFSCLHKYEKELIKEWDEGSKAPKPRLFVTDVTYEALGKRCATGFPSFTWQCDEALVFVETMKVGNRLSASRLGNMNRVWSASDCFSERISRGEVDARQFVTSLCVAGQSDPLLSFFNNPMVSDCGLLGRILSVKIEKSPVRKLRDSPEINEALSFHERCLLKIIQQPFPFSDSEGLHLSPYTVPVCPKARGIEREFAYRCRLAQDVGQNYEMISGFMCKAPIHAVRLATIFACIRRASECVVLNQDFSTDGLMVTQKDMIEGCHTAMFFADEQLRLLGLARRSDRERAVNMVADYIRRKKQPRELLSARTVDRSGVLRSFCKKNGLIGARKYDFLDSLLGDVVAMGLLAEISPPGEAQRPIFQRTDRMIGSDCPTRLTKNDKIKIVKE